MAWQQLKGDAMPDIDELAQATETPTHRRHRSRNRRRSARGDAGPMSAGKWAIGLAIALAVVVGFVAGREFTQHQYRRAAEQALAEVDQAMGQVLADLDESQREAEIEARKFVDELHRALND